jgi:RsiW-degrading membrane proteinase PrsW (M82 family)
MKLLIIALAPVFLIALYVYFRDKYEKEPIGMLLKALLLGVVIPVPVIIVERFLSTIKPELIGFWPAFYDAFFVASFTEELFKYIVLFLLVWKSSHFNEKFDGIVYAVFISLGFAGVENILYVFQYGEMTGYMRALVSVPGHALFGVTMGFYFGMAKFYPQRRKELLIKALLYPILLHGIFDFILMSGHYRWMLMFIPFVIFLYYDGLRKMKYLSDRSVFRNNK